MTNGTASPRNKVPLRANAAKMPTAMPRKYSPTITSAA